MKWIINEDLTAFERLKKKVNLFTTPAVSNAIAGLIISDIKTKFDKQLDVKGKEFAPLKPSTIKQKKRQGKESYKILRDTGQLLNSLNSHTEFNKIIIGYSVPYAKYHQNGTRKMAQRKILPTEIDEIPSKKIKTIISKYLRSF